MSSVDRQPVERTETFPDSERAIIGFRDAQRADLPVFDLATRVFLLSKLMSHLETAQEAHTPTAEPADPRKAALAALRDLTFAEAMRVAAGPVGISISVDCRALLERIDRVDHAISDRELMEAFIKRSASVRLVSRLFNTTEIEVRRLRKAIAPELAAGGRPKRVEDQLREEVQSSWRRLLANPLPAERQRWWLLACEYPNLPIVSMEALVSDESRVPQRK